MLVGIHQPEHLPWLGFFHKIYLSDVFVLLDNVQYRKNYFQNRNRIRTSDGFCWVTVPVLAKNRSSQKIDEVEINQNIKNWQRDIWRTIKQNYTKALSFTRYGPFLEEVYCNNQWSRLVDLNICLIKKLVEWLGIKTKLLIASQLNVEGKSSHLLLDICQKVGATEYLSGKFGRDYLDESKFQAVNIEVIYQDFTHPVYKQVYEPFMPAMSVIDLLMNHGEKSLNILTETEKIQNYDRQMICE